MTGGKAYINNIGLDLFSVEFKKPVEPTLDQLAPV
jgi:hypothetical protein